LTKEIHLLFAGIGSPPAPCLSCHLLAQIQRLRIKVNKKKIKKNGFMEREKKKKNCVAVIFSKTSLELCFLFSRICHQWIKLKSPFRDTCLAHPVYSPLDVNHQWIKLNLKNLKMVEILIKL